ncbi:MAG: hypothetical protein U0M21_00655 [Emergencia sp.]|nr:hypothetical protein [Emergencia sp.]
MIKATSKVTINKAKIKELTDNAITALEKTAEALHTDIQQAQVVPFDKGNLQGEAFFIDNKKAVSGEVILVHSTPYARRLYFHPEYNFQKTENPNAKGAWFVDWLPGGAKENWAQDTFAAIYREESKI